MADQVQTYSIQWLLRKIAMPAITAVVVGLIVYGLFGTGENLSLPSQDYLTLDRQAIQDSVLEDGVFDKPFPATNIFSPLGILSLNSDLLFTDILSDASNIRVGVVAHNVLLLVGTAIVCILIGLTLGYSSWGLLIIMIPALLYPLSLLGLPILEARPWFLALFWQSLSILAFLQAMKTNKTLWFVVLFFALLVALFSMPATIGLAISVASIALLQHTKGQEQKEKLILLSSVSPVFIFLVARIASDVALPDYSVDVLGQTINQLGASLLPLSTLQHSLFSTVSFVLGLIVFATAIYLLTDSWIKSAKSSKNVSEFQDQALVGGFMSLSKSPSSNSVASHQTVFLLLSVASFMLLYNMFDLTNYIDSIDYNLHYAQFLATGTTIVLALIIHFNLPGKIKVKPSVIALATLFSFIGLYSMGNLEKQGDYFNSLGINDNFLVDHYLAKAETEMKKAEYANVLNYIIQAEKIKSDNPEATKMRGMYFAGIGELLTSKQYLLKYLSRVDYADKEAALALANIEIATSKFDAAKNILGRTLTYNPADKEAMALLSVVGIKSDNFQTAAEWARQIVAEGYVVDYLSIEFLNYGVSVFETNENQALEAWDLSGQLNPNYIKPYEKFLVYYVEYYPDFRKALWCVEQIRKRGGSVSRSVITKIYEITPPALRPEFESFRQAT